MNNAIPRIPQPINEPVLSYAPGSTERKAIKLAIEDLKSRSVDIPAIIDGREVFTGDTAPIRPPHELGHTLGAAHFCGGEEVKAAIAAAEKAQPEWSRMPWTDRAAIFLKAADLLAGRMRYQINAATMLGQSKNVHQAEIDAACEMIDFLRFNAYFMEQIYRDQPFSPAGQWNRLEYRPLEGFIFAVTPFNFSSIQGNLPTAPAIMGNTVIWKPASSTVYSAYFFYNVLREAGLPDGVINMVPGRGAAVGDPVFASPKFAGLHFTGSTGTFQYMWKTIAENLPRYKTYPRIVGETGGKDFIIAHPSADPVAVSTAIVRGGFEYQGQKCSAVSRCYLPMSLWPYIRKDLFEQLDQIKMGSVEDFSVFFNAVIDKAAFKNITGYIDHARDADGVEIIHGGGYSDEEGYFIEPTVIMVQDPHYRTMCEEIFGPVVTLFLYDDNQFEETLDLLDQSSPYGLTGAVFAQDRKAINLATERLVHAAGNFYINDKPTGAVVGQQPFGGARASGTNDKAGSYLNLIRWVSARSIKETFDPARHHGYPFMLPE